ncbi:MAG: hypothetical protein PHT07_14940 [Paludibacter sp.]|nr:hypothetical protein [Paludibacter sp.]
MSENRKPSIVFLIRFQGMKLKNVRQDELPQKSHKIELFDSTLWKQGDFFSRKKFRLRINDKWYNGNNDKDDILFLSKWEIRDILWKSIIF